MFNKRYILLTIFLAAGAFVAWYATNNSGDTERYSDNNENSSATQSAIETSKNIDTIVSQTLSENKFSTEDNPSILYSSESSDFLFYDTPTGRLLTNFFSVLDETGPEAQRHYDEALQKLKENVEPATVDLLDAYRRIGEFSPVERYNILFTLMELKSVTALPLFIEVSESPLPAREENIRQGKQHQYIVEYQQEVLIRMRSIGGLSVLAQNGIQEARDTLFRLILDTNDMTLRSEAIQGFLRSSNDYDRDQQYLKDNLSQEDHVLVAIEPTDIAEIVGHVTER